MVPWLPSWSDPQTLTQSPEAEDNAVRLSQGLRVLVFNKSYEMTSPHAFCTADTTTTATSSAAAAAAALSITGDRTIASSQATSMAVYEAAEGLGRTQVASQVGLQASRVATERSTALKAFDSLGGGKHHRRMLQLAMNAARDAVQEALQADAAAGTASVRKAAQKAMAFARLSMNRGTRPWQFSSNDP